MRREDFPQRVGEQEEVGLQAAEAHVRAVFAVLDEAVSGGGRGPGHLRSGGLRGLPSHLTLFTQVAGRGVLGSSPACRVTRAPLEGKSTSIKLGG